MGNKKPDYFQNGSHKLYYVLILFISINSHFFPTEILFHETVGKALGTSFKKKESLRNSYKQAKFKPLSSSSLIFLLHNM